MQAGIKLFQYISVPRLLLDLSSTLKCNFYMTLGESDSGATLFNVVDVNIETKIFTKTLNLFKQNIRSFSKQ